MIRSTAVFLCAAALAGCATVPRDAGVADVQQAVSRRSGQNVNWSIANDQRLTTMLQGDLTADQAVAIALANNPRLQVILADLGIARADLIEASTITNPLLELELRFPARPYHPYELRLAQSLVELIQLPRRRAIGRAAFDAAQMRVTSEILRFGGDVRSDYYDLLAATQHVAMSGTIVESARAAAELALRQHQAQNITDLDLENEQALYEQAKLDLARAEQALLLARETFIRDLGLRDVAAEWRMPEKFPDLPASELDQQQLEQLAAAQRLDIAIARRETEIAQGRIPLARLAALGQFEADVHLQREPDGVRTIGPGITVPIPLFNTGRAARTRAEAQFLQGRHTLNALMSESSSRLRSARATVVEARARVEYYRDVLVPRRKRIVNLTQLELNAMLVGVFQLLQARQNEAQAQRDSIEAQREYWTARANLDRAVNGIAAETTRGGH